MASNACPSITIVMGKQVLTRKGKDKYTDVGISSYVYLYAYSYL
jgi:hypothetical protein